MKRTAATFRLPDGLTTEEVLSYCQASGHMAQEDLLGLYHPGDAALCHDLAGAAWRTLVDERSPPGITLLGPLVRLSLQRAQERRMAQAACLAEELIRAGLEISWLDGTMILKGELTDGFYERLQLFSDLLIPLLMKGRRDR